MFTNLAIHMQLALQSSNDGLWQWNLRSGATQWSTRVYELLGYTPNDLGSDIGTFLRIVHPEDLRSSRRTLLRHLREHRTFSAEYRLRLKSGAYRWFWIRGQAIRGVDGQELHMGGSITDVTERKELEAELAQSHKLEAIGQLSAGIAHEINTPTQFIGNNLGFIRDAINEVFEVVQRISRVADRSGGTVAAKDLLEMLQSVELPYLLEEVPNALKQSLEGIERIQNIVGAMKEFSHPAVDKTLLDINRAISSTIVVASNEWKYVAELTSDFDPDLPTVPVMPGSFNQVILNIIVNAAHAISDVVDGGSRGKGMITVSTRRVDQWAEIRIQDTGGGIPEKLRDRIFDPFFTTKGVGKGTGQGLAIAHDVIVKKHGGAIAVESEPDVGTTLILRLPLAASGAAASAA